MISRSGSDCDKIGTSFAAFRSQGNACERPLGSCLSGQIEDVWEADQTRIAEGTVPVHRLHKFYGTVDPQAWYSNAYDTEAAGWRLSLPFLAQRSSLLHFEMAADGLSFSRNISGGEIVSAEICQFGDGAECGTFEDLTQRGFLRVVVKNTGFVDALYHVAVPTCSPGLLPPGAQARAIATQSEDRVVFELFRSEDQGGEDHSCT